MHKILTLCLAFVASATTCAHAQWSEWRELGSFMLPQGEPDDPNAGYFGTHRYTFKDAGVPFPDFSAPVTVMERINSADGLTQLRLDNMFNDHSIILDVDANGFITCEPQETDIINFKKTSESQPDYLLFEVNGGYYYPVSGQITWKSSRLCSDYGYILMSEPTSQLQISGYTPLLFDPENDMYLPSTASEATVHVTKAPEVDFYRVIPKRQNEGWDNNIEMLYKHAVPSGEPYAYTDYRTESFTIKLWDARTDFYIIPFSSDGRAAGDAIYRRINKNFIPEGNWRPLGKGLLTESACYYFTEEYRFETDLPSIESEVELETSDTPRSMIRIKNPFGPAHPLYDKITKFTDIEFPDEDYYLTFDISDPNRVTIPVTMWAPYPYTVGCWVSEYLELGIPESVIADMTYMTWGTYDNGRITIHQSTLPLPPRGNIILDITSGGEDSVDSVGSDYTNTPAEYYNLQGVRVSAPSGGIFIRRQDTTVTRILLP